MPTAYSKDLREKVILFLKKGRRQEEVVRCFSVSRASVVRWNKQLRETGGLTAQKQGRKRGKSRVEEKALRDYVAAYPDRTLIEIGKHFGVSGVLIWKRLKQIGFTFKKRPSAIRNATRRGGRSSKN